MDQILIYYKYVTVFNPESIAKWQKELCERLKLKGRIIIAKEGINGTVGGSIEALNKYKAETTSNEIFKDIDFKESEGSAEHFPRLRVIVKNEIVRLGLDPDLIKAEDGGVYLTPKEVNQLIESEEDLVLLDTRNDYESKIGTFVNAITPNTKTFREFPGYVDQNLDVFKDKKVLMFCTGGVRCERASAYLKSKKVTKEVYHIKGGIHRYIEAYPNGYFRGKNYVFDARIATQANADILANCEHCNIPYDDYTNCVNAECNRQIIVCKSCIKTYHNTCSQVCLELVQKFKVNIRTKDKKINSEFS